MPYFEALKSSACNPKIWSMPVAPGLMHTFLRQSHCKWNNLPSLFFSRHSGRLQHTTDSFKAQKLFWYHVIEFHRDFFSSSFPPLLRHQVVCSPTEIVGEYAASYPLCMADVLHAVGYISNFNPFSSSSCGPSPARLSHILPRFPISLSFDMGWEWQAGEWGRPQVGSGTLEYSCQKLSGSCQLIPWMKIFHCGLSLWLETFPNPLRAFPEALKEVAVCRDEKHGRDFPFCAFRIQRHLSPVSSPHTLALFKATFVCLFASCYHSLLFHSLFHAISYILESFPSAIGQQHSFSFSLSPLVISPDSLFSKYSLKWAITFPHILLPFWLTLFCLIGQSPPPPF